MNREDPSQELMKKRKQRNLENNNDKLSHAWPRDPQQSGSKPLMRNPLPFFLAHTALPRCHVHITWPSQQTNRPVKKQHPYRC
jgi:hypothetical protein